MPFTPFHFGPGAALHAAAPRHISFMAFCAANVMIDLESLYNLVSRKYPVHAFFHTIVGAAVILVIALLLFEGGKLLARRCALPDLFGWQSLARKKVALGAALGAYSHILLDSLMHRDIQPLAPFSASNPLLGMLPLGVLHIACALLALAGLGVVVIRRFYVARLHPRVGSIP